MALRKLSSLKPQSQTTNANKYESPQRALNNFSSDSVAQLWGRERHSDDDDNAAGGLLLEDAAR
jgi:hypothetical protein